MKTGRRDRFSFPLVIWIKEECLGGDSSRQSEFLRSER